MISGATHPRFDSDWPAENDVATSVDKHRMEFETLGSQVAQGIVNTLPAEFQRKFNVLKKIRRKEEGIRFLQAVE